MKKKIFLFLLALAMIFASCDSSGSTTTGDGGGGGGGGGGGLPPPSPNPGPGDPVNTKINITVAKNVIERIAGGTFSDGGVFLFMGDDETGNHVLAPVISGGIGSVTFRTIVGRTYNAYFEFCIGLSDGTGQQHAQLMVPFVSGPNDVMTFFLNYDYAGLTVNGASHNSNMIWTPDAANTHLVDEVGNVCGPAYREHNIQKLVAHYGGPDYVFVIRVN